MREYMRDRRAGKIPPREKRKPTDIGRKRANPKAGAHRAKMARKGIRAQKPLHILEVGQPRPTLHPRKGEIIQFPVARVFQPLLAPRRYKGARGGRASGKSHFFAEQIVSRCLRDPALRVVCIREKQISLKYSSKQLIEDKIRKFKVVGRFRILKTEIEVLDNKGRVKGIIIFQGMQNHTAESIKSLEGFDIAWVEEASSLSERSWGLLRPTIRKDGSEIWCSWNPQSPKDPVEKFFNEAIANGSTDHICVDANFEHNPWFPEVTQKEMEYDKRRDFERYLHVWCGKYAKLSHARVFRNWRIGNPEEFKELRVAKLTPRYGGDFGFSVDPTVGVRMRIDDANMRLYIDREVYKIGCEIVDTPALFDKLDDGNARKYSFIADSARPETISHCKKNGYPLMRGAKKGPGSVEEGVKFLLQYEIIVHPDCVHTIDELTLYSYKIDRLTEEVLPELDDKKNHVIDAVRYALETVRARAKAGALF
jgi:phage terminase large subunit